MITFNGNNLRHDRCDECGRLEMTNCVIVGGKAIARFCADCWDYCGPVDDRPAFGGHPPPVEEDYNPWQSNAVKDLEESLSELP